MIFYTADPHFGYEKVIESACRPFSCAAEMDEALIRNWNDVVTDEDTVYLIGDVGSYQTPFPAQQLSQLRGHKHLIRGNHDSVLENQQQFFDHFESVSDYLELYDGNIPVKLCHYPLVYLQHGYMIHGHLHNVQKEMHQILTQMPMVMNACVDINHFRPVTLEELVKNNQEFFRDPQRGVDEIMGKWKSKWNMDFRPLPTK